MLELGIELSERLLVTDGDEHRIVAESPLAAWRPDEDAVDAAVECLGLTIVGPGECERAGEMRRGRSVRAGGFGLVKRAL